MQAMTLSVANVVGPGFVGRPVAMKNGEIGKRALQSVTLTLKLSLKMPYFPD